MQIDTLVPLDKENSANVQVPTTPPHPTKQQKIERGPSPSSPRAENETCPNTPVPNDSPAEVHPGSPVQNHQQNRIEQLKQDVLQVKQVKEVEIDRKYTHVTSMEEIFEFFEDFDQADAITSGSDESRNEKQRKYTEEDVKKITEVVANRVKELEIDLINLQEDCIQYQQEYFKIKEEGCSLYEIFVSKTNSLKDLKEKYQFLCEQYDLLRSENNELMLQVEHANLLASEWKLKHKQQADRFKDSLTNHKILKEENTSLKQEISKLQESSKSKKHLPSASQNDEVQRITMQLNVAVAEKDTLSNQIEDLKESYQNVVHSQQLKDSQVLFLKKKCSNLLTELKQTIFQSIEDPFVNENNEELFSLNQKLQDTLSLLLTDDEDALQRSMNSHSLLDSEFGSFKALPVNSKDALSSSQFKSSRVENKEVDNEQLESLQISNEILRSEVEELQKKLHQSQLLSSKYESQIQVSKSKIQNLQESLSEMQQQVNSTSSSTSNMTNEIQLLKMQVRSLESEVNTLTSQNQTLSTERSSITTKLAELQSLNSNLQNDMRLIYKKHKMDLASLDEQYKHEDYKARYQLILAEYNQMKNHYQTSFDLFDTFVELIGNFDQLKELVESNSEMVVKVHHQNSLLAIDRSVQTEYLQLTEKYSSLEEKYNQLFSDFNAIFPTENVESNEGEHSVNTQFGEMCRNMKEEHRVLSVAKQELESAIVEKDLRFVEVTDRCGKLEAELQSMTKQYNELSQEYETIKLENDQVNAMIEQNEMVSQKFDDMLVKIASLNQTLQNERTTFRQTLQAKENEVMDLTNQIEALNNDNNSLSLQVQSVQNNFSEFKEKEFQILLQNYQIVTKNFNEATDNLQKLNEDIQEMKIKNQNYIDQNKSLQENEEFLQESVKSLNSQVEKLEAELENLQQKLISSEIQEERASDLWKKKEKQLTDQIGDLQNSIELKEKKILKIEQEMEKKLSSSTEEFENQIAKLNSSLSKLEKQKENSTLQLEQLQSEVQEKDMDVFKKEQQIEALNEQLQEAISKHQSLQDEQMQKLQKLEEQIKSMEVTFGEREVQWKDLEQQYTEQKEKLKSEIEGLQIFKELAEKREKQLGEYNLENANLKQLLGNESFLVSELRKANKSLQEEIRSQLVDLKVVEDERNSLSLDIQSLLVICEQKGILNEATLFNEKSELERKLAASDLRLLDRDLKVKELDSLIETQNARFVELKEKYKIKLLELQSQILSNKEEISCLNKILQHIRELVSTHQEEISQSKTLNSLLSLIPQSVVAC